MCSRLCLCRRASPPAAASSSTAGGGPGATAPPTDNLRALELNLAGLLFSAPLFGSSCWCHTASQGKTASPHLYFASVKPEAPKYPPKLTRNRIGANISFLPWLRWFESDCLKQKPASQENIYSCIYIQKDFNFPVQRKLLLNSRVTGIRYLPDSVYEKTKQHHTPATIKAIRKYLKLS